MKMYGTLERQWPQRSMRRLGATVLLRGVCTSAAVDH